MTVDAATTIAGNLTDAPELRYTPAGVPVASFSIAVNHRKSDGKGGWTDDGASFFRCTAWRELASNLAESLGKGDRIIASGRLRQRSWETPEGDKRSQVELTVEDAGPSLRWAQAKPQRITRQHEAAGPAAAGDFNDEPPF